MTAREAKQRATELWGDAGLFARLMIVFALIGSVWVGLTAAKNTVEVWLVPQSQYARDLDSLSAFFTRQQIADIQWKAADAEFKREMRQKQYEDCVRHHSGRACIPPK
jgi:hypothetical protein